MKHDSELESLVCRLEGSLQSLVVTPINVSSEEMRMLLKAARLALRLIREDGPSPDIQKRAEELTRCHDTGVWMTDKPFISAARKLACIAMESLGLDADNDFRTRDKVINAIAATVNGMLDAALAAAEAAGRERGIEEAAKIMDARHEFYQAFALKLGLNTDSDYYHADCLSQEDAAAIRQLAGKGGE